MKRVGTRKLAVARQLAGIILFVSLCGCLAVVFTLGINRPSVHVHEVTTVLSDPYRFSDSHTWSYDPMTKSYRWMPKPDVLVDIQVHSVIPELVDSTIDWVFVGWGIAIFILGMVSASCLGSALYKLNYPLAIVGSICATLAILPLGLPLLILIIRSRDEFRPVVLS